VSSSASAPLRWIFAALAKAEDCSACIDTCLRHSRVRKPDDPVPDYSHRWLARLETDLTSLQQKAAAAGINTAQEAPAEAAAVTQSTAAAPPSTPTKATQNTSAQSEASSSSSSSSSSFTALSTHVSSPRSDLIGPPSPSTWRDRTNLYTESRTGLRGAMSGVPPGRTNQSWPFPPRREQLMNCVLSGVRDAERSLSVRAALQADVDRATAQSKASAVASPSHSSASSSVRASSSFTAGNFAYGSTALHSWDALTAVPAIASALERARNTASAVLVLGSSLGIINYYLSIMHNVLSIGIDLLPTMVETAQQIGREGGLFSSAEEAESDEHVQHARRMSKNPATVSSTDVPLMPTFLVGDATCVDRKLLGATTLVILTSQAWDTHLRRAVYARLLTCLPHDAIVVDYLPPALTGTATATSNSAPDAPTAIASAAALPLGFVYGHTFVPVIA
jgi:hypothetical protein